MNSKNTFNSLIDPFLVTAGILLAVDHWPQLDLSDFILLVLIVLLLGYRAVSRFHRNRGETGLSGSGESS